METSFGAAAPGISTAPITMSASITCCSIASREEASPCTRLLYRQNDIRSLSRSVSNNVTSAPIPSAMFAAFCPETPAPMITTLALATPPTPPINTPRPPWAFISAYAPTCGARQPATSDIGYSSGSPPEGSCTVS